MVRPDHAGEADNLGHAVPQGLGGKRHLRLELKATNDNYIDLKREVDVLKRAIAQ